VWNLPWPCSAGPASIRGDPTSTLRSRGAAIARSWRGSSGCRSRSIIDAFPRHRTNLSKEALAQLRADESAGVLLHLATQRSTLLRVQDRAERAGNEVAVMQAARELHKNIELTGRTLGTFAEHERAITQVAHLGILMSPEYVDLRANLIKALAPHPAARLAVGAVLAGLEGRVPQFPGQHRQVIDGISNACPTP
jgi:hypothetical protein